MAALNKDVMDSFLGGNAEEGKKKAAPSRMGYYKRYLETGDLLPKIKFTHGDRTEGLWLNDEDVKVTLPVSELFDAQKFVNHYVFLDHLQREYAVKVIAVDAEKKIVTVSVIKAQESAKPEVLANIEGALKKGEHPRMKAIVEFLPRDNMTNRSKLAYLNILGLGIQGVLRNKDYADAFIPDLSPIIKIGDVVDVAITGKESSYKGQIRYTCSRKEVVPSLWANLGDYVKVDQMVRVECLTPMTTNFVGRILDLPDITCSCVYPKGIYIESGAIYSGFVTKIDPANHHLYVEIGRAEDESKK